MILRRWLLYGAFVLLPYLAQGQISSNFSSGADGWTAPGSQGGTLNFNAAAGNPLGSGAVSASDAITAGPPIYWYFAAPAKFRGNRCASYNKNLSFDLSQSSPGGTDTSHPDVVLTGSGITLTFSISPSPPITPAWRTYTVLLNETSGWKTSFGSPPSKDQFKSVLCNITALGIRGKYSTGTLLSSALDNVIMGELTVGTPPVIASIIPSKAVPGSTVTINGANFNSNATGNVVFFGPVKSIVQSATAAQLTVLVPTGACPDRISVLNMGTNLVGESSQIFNPLFDNNLDYGGKIIASSMDLVFKINLDVNAAKGYPNVADLDGDGLTDLLVVETNIQKFSVFRNLGLTGDINSGSFAVKVSFSIGGTTKGATAIADFDNDGKLDVAVGTTLAGVAYVALFRNASSPGNVTFDPVQYVVASGYSDGSLHAADIDGDGRMDILSAFNNACGAVNAYFSIFQNMSQPGDIEFCSFVDFDFGAFCQANSIATGDLNGDGKLDIAVSTNLDANFFVFQNNSTPGSIILATPFVIDSPGQTYNVVMADFDSDGKLDLASKSSSPNEVYIKRNTHTAGALAATSFGADIALQTPLGNLGSIVIADINADGKPDIVGNDDINLGIIQNNFTSGTLTASSFAAGVLFEGPVAFASTPTNPVISDFDRDSKPDVVFGTTNTSPAMLAIYRNECFPTPTITSLSSLTAVVGKKMTIQGGLFNTGNQTPVLTFGPVTAAAGITSNNSVATTVPPGAGYAPIAVTLHGLSVFNSLPFSTTFPAGDIKSSTFTTSVDFPMVFNSGAMVVGDFDGDGKIDILAEDSSKVRIWRNTLATPGVAISNTTLTLLPNAYAGASQLACSDVDGDGKMDLIANGIIKRNNSGSTTEPISFESNITSVASSANRFVTNHDFNRDGKMDLAYTSNGNVINATENTSRKGPFTYFPFPSFQAVAQWSGGGQVLGIDAGDFDGDGYDDIAYTVSSGTLVNILLNSEQEGPIINSMFSNPVPFTVGTSPYGIVAADLDRDGKLDLAVSNYGSSFVTILKNTSTPGSLSFLRQDITALGFSSALKAADLNGDGKPELVTIHAPTATTGSFGVFPNTSTNGNIGFGNRIDFTLPDAPGGLALADINLDQKTDVIIVRNGDFLSVFQNNLPFADNDPPVIAAGSGSALVGGSANLDLTSLLSDPDDNLDLSSLTILVPPSSGAPAIIDANHFLVIDYEGLAFLGFDHLTIEVCDFAGACTQKELDINVTSTVIVYNAVSPNGDGKNEKFVIQFIDLIPSMMSNEVKIYNRWGDEVFAINDYNNTSRVFTGQTSDGKPLPSGTYFYKIVFSSGAKSLMGFLELRR